MLYILSLHGIELDLRALLYNDNNDFMPEAFNLPLPWVP